MSSKRKRRSHGGSRNVRLLLLSLGLCTLALAGGLVVLGVTGHNRALLRYALYYAMASVIFMSLRAMLLELKQRRKRRIKRMQARDLTPETGDL